MKSSKVAYFHCHIPTISCLSYGRSEAPIRRTVLHQPSIDEADEIGKHKVRTFIGGLQIIRYVIYLSYVYVLFVCLDGKGVDYQCGEAVCCLMRPL